MVKYSFAIILIIQMSYTFGQEVVIDLAGPWSFQIDRNDKGIQEKWFSKKLADQIILPGSMTTNGKGDEVSVNTPWVGSIFDSAYFKNPEYEKFRVEGNIKVPFWLQPVKYYQGPAWYQKMFSIPKNWSDQFIELFIERAHWETSVWIDGEKIGMQNSLGAPHRYEVLNKLKPGNHTLTIRVDNRVKEVNVGQNSHSISDHTQSNWNGMIGKLELRSRPLIRILDLKVFPDVANKKVLVKLNVENLLGQQAMTTVQCVVQSSREKLKSVSKEVKLGLLVNEIVFDYPMGDNPALWNEFTPNVYTMEVILMSGAKEDRRQIAFGMRNISSVGTQFAINDIPIFLRGTLECAIFPKTGYPPTDKKEWARIFSTIKSFGLNHVRFHSWCPPEAAFNMADSLGVYLQIECSSWANWGTGLGDGTSIDQYIYDEANRIVDTYGNHPSFCFMAYGNEPGGKNHVKYLTDFVNYWKDKDSRRQYTTGAGWPPIAENDYNNLPEPRIQHWEEGLNSIINRKPPSFDYDWSDTISKWSIPTVSHEIGQWCVYPDFKEIEQYDGVLKAKNFEIFQYTLEQNRMANLADSFLLASGKLQTLCYKADIEAALRTKNFGGFQLLDLHDFPGQGTALVGVLNPFWKEKGYVTGKEYSQFCNSVVPLIRFQKMVFRNDEALDVPVEVSNFSGSSITGTAPEWNIADASGKVLFQGTLSRSDIPIGNGFSIGRIQQSLKTVQEPSRLVVSVSLGKFQNSWDIFVYPTALPELNDNILIVDQLDSKAIETLNKGGKVLLTVKKGSIKPEVGGDIAIGFSSIFWNTAWTNGQAPHTLGILCNPKHSALSNFPTQYHSNWQWWDGMSHSNAIRLDAIDSKLQPIVRVIDDWVTARPLGLVFECRVGKGRLMVSGIDLVTDQAKRIEARQLLYSLRKYMGTNAFNPQTQVAADKIKNLFQ